MSARPLRGRDRKWLWATSALSLLVLLGAGVGIAVAVNSSPPTTTTTSTTSTSTIPDELTNQRAASAIALLLAESATERSVVVATVHDVGSCGPRLTSDASTFARSIASRRTLEAKLAAIRRRSSLSEEMFNDLAAAWQASIQADRDFMGWARDEVSHGCIIYDPSDRYLNASTAPDSEATFYKTGFTKLWDPIAKTYGEPSYQPDQL